MARRRDEATDFALKGGEIAAKLFGLTEPVAATLGVLIGAISDHRRRRQFQRLERLVNSVEARLGQLEGNLRRPQDQNLLHEILAHTVNDEDEDKTRYYAALIEYCVSARQDAYQVRLLGDAFKSLTAHEIKAFVHFSKHAALRYDIPGDLKDIFWDRVCTAGLYRREKITTSRVEYTTFLGKKFLEVCELATSRAKHGHTT
jgi:hypothetical protein